MISPESVVVLHGKDRDQYAAAVNKVRDADNGLSVHGFTDTCPNLNPYNEGLVSAVMNADVLLIADNCITTPDGTRALSAAAFYGIIVEPFTDTYELDFDALRHTPYWKMASADRISQGYAPFGEEIR